MSSTALPAIVAERKDHVTQIHGYELKDAYYWLREKTNEQVIDYIKAENTYCEESTAQLKPVQEQLYKEFLARVKQTDET